MPSINKKGNADLLAIVLLSLIGMLLVTIVYPFVIDWIEDEAPKLSPRACEEVTNEQLLYAYPSCYNSTTNDLKILLTKRSKEKLRSLTFRLKFENETKDWECGTDCSNCRILGEESKEYHIFPGRMPEKIEIISEECILESKEIVPCS